MASAKHHPRAGPEDTGRHQIQNFPLGRSLDPAIDFGAGRIQIVDKIHRTDAGSEIRAGQLKIGRGEVKVPLVPKGISDRKDGIFRRQGGEPAGQGCEPPGDLARPGCEAQGPAMSLAVCPRAPL